MPDHPEIYRGQAEQYEALVSREGYQGNLLPALQKVTPFTGQTVIELGAGTGRLTCQLAPLVKRILAFDISEHMLELARLKLSRSGLQNWHTEVADHRQIPLADHTADVVISGWSVCYIVVDHPQTWRVEMDRVMGEMNRLLRSTGKIILIETLGTGFTLPTPPDHLIDYYAYLETCGFEHTWIRSDYLFEDMETAK